MLTNEEYARRVEELSPPSPLVKNCALAFVCGGGICVLGQGLITLYRGAGLPLQQARIAESVTLIFLSAALTALGWYDRIAKHAGAGTLVPITGFANAVASPALEFRAEGMVTGLGAKLFAVSGPVLVYGVAAAMVYGLVVWIFSLMGVVL